jgi:TolA-binding protein
MSHSIHQRMSRRLALLLVVFLSGTLSLSAFDPADQLQFANGLYVRGLYDLALDEYLRISREAETFEYLDQVLYRIGECHRRLDNPQAAERFYVRVLREYPEGAYSFRAAFRRAEVLSSMGRYLDALNLFRALLEREDPTGELVAPALYYRGDAARRLLFRDEAVEAFQRVRSEFPDSPFAAYAALDLATMFREDPEQADQVLSLYASVSDNPATDDVGAEALFQQGEWHFRLADYEASAAAYDLLLDRYPEARRTGEARLPAAWAWYHIGRHSEAAALARTVLAGPAPAQEAEWLYLLANCQRQLLRAEDAQATYARLIESYPEHQWARIAAYETALLAFRRDQFDEAIEAAQQIQPDADLRQDLFWLLAESYAAVGRDDEAVQHYRMVLDADPEGPHAPRAMYRLGRVLQNRRDYAQAARTYRELATRFDEDPFAPEAWLAAGFCMVMSDRIDEAIEDWRRLVEQYPDAPLAAEARYQTALAHMQQNRNAEARTAFADFLQHHPASAFAADAHFRMGMLWQDAGDAEAAEQAFRQALAAAPEAELAARVQYRLALNLHGQGKSAEAADLLQSVLLSADAAPPPALLEWLAVYRLEEGAYEQALAAALVLQEQADTAAWRQMAWALIGRSRLGLGQSDEALQALTNGLEEPAHTREGAEAAALIGRIHLEAGRPEEAVPYLEQAIERSADDALADVRARSFFALGEAFETLADHRRAARYYLAVAVLFDDAEWVPQALHRGARMLELSGRTEEQQRTLTELQTRFPDWQPAP